MESVTIKALLPSNNGLFTALKRKIDYLPWELTNTVDMDYIAHSGDKIGAPILRTVTGGQMASEADLDTLAGILANHFSHKWQKLYETTQLQYNPISNYDMTETERTQGTTTDTRTDDTTHTRTADLTTTANGTQNAGTDTSTYGFNTTTPAVPTGQSDTVGSSEATTKETGTDTTTDTGTVTDKGDSDIERTLERSGNIGVTTSQQMIEAERQVADFDFIQQIFADVDRILTLKIY